MMRHHAGDCNCTPPYQTCQACNPYGQRPGSGPLVPVATQSSAAAGGTWVDGGMLRAQQAYQATERAIAGVLSGGINVVQQAMLGAVGTLVDGVSRLASSIGNTANSRGGAPGCYTDTLDEIPSECGIAGKQCDYRIPFGPFTALPGNSTAVDLNVPGDFVPTGAEYVGPPEAIRITVYVDDTYYAKRIFADAFFGNRLNQRFNTQRVYPGKPLSIIVESDTGFPATGRLQFTGIKAKR